METSLQIVWEHMEPSDFLRGRIEREVAALERTFGRITSCKVFVEGPSHRQHKGGLFAVRARLLLPGGLQIDASRNPPQDHAHEDAYVVVRDVFDALRRQLRERVRERREEVQHPDSQPHGVISQLFPERDHGFIRADDGREIYFHRNAVLTEFDKLRVGAEVHFSEDEGREGPQASSVRAYGVGARPD
ncbi:MAG: HPF/RaiA family ribosome-associated protein [Hyphomonadaceae bacterium]|nr:HPF/RaiA family ribosome-associated protein [Hyphomonadaceae bacterium]